MALLATLDRRRVGAHVMRLAGACPGSLTKADLRAAVDATDDWIEANAASYVAALPAAWRAASGPMQKTVLFCLVAMRRSGLLRVEGD